MRREAQERVNHDLTIVHTQYQEELSTTAQRLIDEGARLTLGGQDLAAQRQRIKDAYDFTILNVCDVNGNPVSGSYPDKAPSVPISSDPVLRRALEGKPAWGTVVIEKGAVWNDRAWVVDEWYPDANIIGMLYIGLLEAPYNALRTRVVVKVVWPVVGLLLTAAILSLLVVVRITSPLRNLSEAASHLGEGNWGYTLKATPTFREIATLSQVFQDMQRAIVERDQQLRKQNRILQQANEKLDRTLGNYMHMLGFITHELKSPLATVQSMISTMIEGYAGKLPEKASPLVARKTDIDFRSEVVEPSVAQTSGLFVAACSSQATGFFSGEYDDVTAIVGSRTKDQIEASCLATNLTLTGSQVRFLEEGGAPPD